MCSPQQHLFSSVNYYKIYFSVEEHEMIYMYQYVGEEDICQSALSKKS